MLWPGLALWRESEALAWLAPLLPSYLGGSGRGMTVEGNASEAGPVPSRNVFLCLSRPCTHFPFRVGGDSIQILSGCGEPVMNPSLDAFYKHSDSQAPPNETLLDQGPGICIWTNTSVGLRCTNVENLLT